MRSALVLVALLHSACRFDHALAPGDGGNSGDDVIDAEIDMMVDPFDPNCFGKTPFRVCLQTLPTASVSLPTAINTASTGTNNCLSLGGAVMMVSNVEACVIAGTNVDVSMTRAGVFGPRPLVLLATGTISVTTMSFDITSRTATPTSDGPNANPPQCMPALTQNGASENGGGGGGAGGSFGGKGANGATGSNGAAAGGTARVADTTFDVLRGGCAGGTGGAGQSTTATGGSGGGALYLAAQGAINITGTINASGAGGFGGEGPRGGGGGGGSGGMIVLYAPTLDITPTGRVFANGGGGGGGAGNTITDGSDGADAVLADSAAGGGLAGDVQGTPGGSGAFKATQPTSAQGAAQGAGGGGGGAGVIRILSGQSVAAINVSPTPILN